MPYRTNFGDLPKENSQLKTAKVVILPAPFDGTSTWGKGADKGPEAIIEASANMELYDIETDSEVYKKNIFTAKPVVEKGKPERMVKKVRLAASEFLKQEKFIITLGGEHSITAGVVSAYADKFKNLSVLQLDAHLDLRQEYLGSKYSHASVMSRVRELCPIAQVGVRSMDITEKPFIDKTRVFFAENIYNKTDWQDKAIAKLTDKVYITIDLDVFDPSVLPSTGTPEPGGLGWYQVLNFLKRVCEKKQVIGFDIVELCPNKNEKSSDFLAAKLIYKLLSYKFH
ncbi:agmatinase [Patescibacteria group bacterium]|nr:agmatinase [Patescibacteria group bacterium]MBU1663688.1 agmatinase [Patescibacteria group bacterium]MBU1934325.1 agmatinase [Patescibacteria group bacterium]MBU2007739.1 agmatinase [Patescibacteria group bacterium]MBU2233637.1 agmatinase [Patescibacteria group bacterium]